MYSLFIFDSLMNTMTYAHTLANKTVLIEWAHKKFKDSCWFAIYKFDSYTQLFGSKIQAMKWTLDTKFAGKTATDYCRAFTPLETAYKIDDGEWYFKTF